MKYLKLFEDNEQTVYLDDLGRGHGFYTKKYGDKSISSLNIKIKNYINKTYGKFGYNYNQHLNKDLNVGGKFINTQYIDKMVNNYTIFKNVILLNKITNEDDFYDYMELHFDDIYGYNGSFFNRESLPILINSSRKGNINEKKSLERFVQYAKTKGLNIVTQSPTNSEDIDGIDGKFTHNGRIFTIQIKPFTSYVMSEDKIRVRSVGSVSVNTDYLVLYNNDSYIILKNPERRSISIESDNFITSKSNVLETPEYI